MVGKATQKQNQALQMIRPNNTSVNEHLREALKDLRIANDRSSTDGSGDGNSSKASFLIGCAIIDTLAGSTVGGASQASKWYSLLSEYGYPDDETMFLLAAYQSVSHGYWVPQPLNGRHVHFTDTVSDEVIDTTQDAVNISIPAFNTLVEAIAAKSYGNWDTSLTDTDIHL